MTREEAIKYLNEFILFKKISNTTEREAVECFKLAVEALQEHQHYKDLTESYEKTINKLTKAIAEEQLKTEGARGDIPLQQSVPKMPQPEKHTETGHWIEHKRGEIEHIECSECGVWFLRKDLIRNSYCPNCGSRNHWEWELKMQEVKK